MATLIGTSGDDVLTGTSDADLIQGLDGRDQLTDGGGNDRLEGGAGSDTLTTTGGADLLVGGEGIDTIIVRLTAGTTGGVTTLTDFAALQGFSTSIGRNAILNGTVETIRFDVPAGTAVIQRWDGGRTLFDIEGGGVQHQVVVEGIVAPGQANNPIGDARAVLRFVGTDAAETLRDGATITEGRGGDDVFRIQAAGLYIGGSGADRFELSVLQFGPGLFSYPDFGINIPDFETGVDRIVLPSAIGAGAPVTIQRYAGGSVVTQTSNPFLPAVRTIAEFRTVLDINGGDLGPAEGGADGPVTMIGHSGADRLVGGSGADSLDGGDGSDLLVGGLGRDVLTGGAGRDRFLFRSVAESTTGAMDTVTDFQSLNSAVSGPSADQLVFDGSATLISIIRQGAASSVFAASAAGTYAVAVNGAVNISDVAVSNGENGSRSVSTYLQGGSSADTLLGFFDDDTINGGGGDDLIDGGWGADRLAGGAGADTFRFSARRSTPPSATFTAETGDTIVDFETGVDRITSMESAQAVAIIRSGTTSTLFINVPSVPETAAPEVLGISTVVQGELNARDLDIAGVGAANGRGVFMLGGATVDVMIGSAGRDNLQGGAGDDWLTGGGSPDDLVGGAGADRFVYSAIADSALGGADTIHDFQAGVDKLDLSALRSVTVSQLRTGVISQGGGTFVFVDVGGDGTTDMLIQLANLNSFSTADLLF